MTHPTAMAFTAAPGAARVVCSSTQHKRSKQQNITTTAAMRTTNTRSSKVGGGGVTTVTIPTARRVRGASLVMAATPPRVVRRPRSPGPEGDDGDGEVIDVSAASADSVGLALFTSRYFVTTPI
jgi:hypothetical protein